MSEKQEITPEQLEALLKQYPVPGGVAIGSSSMISWHYDNQGNRVKITIDANKGIAYVEYSGDPNLHI